MNSVTVRALEDLLRRVLQAPLHGIDLRQQSEAARERATEARVRRELATAAVVALGLIVLLLGWYLGRHGVG